MPFKIPKLSIISTVDAKQKEDNGNLWNKNVELNNDIYIYIEKNSEYKKTETIKSVEIDNIKIITEPQKGGLEFYKPSTSEKNIYENIDEYKIENLIYDGDSKTNIKELKISNQGGMFSFRASNLNVGEYTSNDEELKYTELLKKMDIKYDEISSKIGFDITIVLQDGKKFKTNIELDIPVQEVIENGKGGKEITDLNLIFKRVEN